ncbi:MAG: tRNA 2-thiouridine(34) synthase MnmA [Elusimicrobiota bacterium]|jgi:tRNA-specific 2-thiouridylase|nr:tRNA 2-thiouridine(34) synthase MnmA [Elusimicrobiota bacterium]
MNVLVGLSGGVDSAVCAYLLKKKGYSVSGAMMSIWDTTMPYKKSNESANTCFGPDEEDIESARKIANFLNIPFHVIDCKEAYKKIVIGDFRDEYREGRTPNPCIWCNAAIKFGILPSVARKQGIAFDKFATGHYANVELNEALQMYQLRKAVDASKDQSYFLYRLSQDILSQVIFPLGTYLKSEVRNIAKIAGIFVAEKSDSQDFYCGNYNDVLQFNEKHGNIVDKNGKVLGKHSGIWNYTIGKRKGLGLSGGFKEPLYVVKISQKNNTVVVGGKEDLYSRSFIVRNVNWVSVLAPKKPIKAQVKIRQQHPPAMALITVQKNNTASVDFENPQMSVTPGQSAVFYDACTVLGGGIVVN